MLCAGVMSFAWYKSQALRIAACCCMLSSTVAGCHMQSDAVIYAIYVLLLAVT